LGLKFYVNIENKVKNSIVFASYCNTKVIIIQFRRLGIVNYLCVAYVLQ
jgi:hypothetical protein